VTDIAVREALLGQARALGADLAGIARVADLRARSVLVVAVAHPPERPELDWWFGRNDPPGNKLLARIVEGLCDWAGREFGFCAVHLPYHVERGGIYLKDAAVLAGLGCIGRNNLLVTPAHGPRVRLRALTLDVELPPTGPVAFDPCSTCDAPCRAACPQGAFSRGTARGASSCGDGQEAGAGDFFRPSCEVQMEFDIAAASVEVVGAMAGTASAAPAGPGGARAPAARETVKVIRYCRACELSCPVGA
jgi:epoxyqueuosine reductase